MLLVIGGAIVIVALANRFPSAEQHPSEGTAEQSLEKERVGEFWRLNGAANRQRLSGHYQEAARLYRESLQLNPRHEDSIYYLGASLEESGEYEEAASAYGRLAEIDSSSSRAFAQLGAVLSLAAPGAAADFEGAREAYRQAARLNPEHSGSALNLGLLSLDEGKLEQAREHFQTASQFGSPAGTFWLGYTLYLRAEKDQAASYFRKVLEGYELERGFSSRGAALEGDILPGDGQLLTAQQQAVLASMIFLDRAAGRVRSANKERDQAPSAEEHRKWVATPAKHSFPPGGRAGWADYDNDGRPDVAVGGSGRPLRIYRNTPDGFVDSTQAAGPAGILNGWDLVWADFDRDSFLDLYVIRPGFSGEGENQLFRNNGKGAFGEVTRRFGLGGRFSTSKAVFVDLDQDELPELVEAGSPSGESRGLRIYRNDGDSFREVAGSWGVTPEGTIVDCVPIDFDSDGRVDLFVLRWKRPAVLYRNRGGGKFADVTAEAKLDGIGMNSLSALAFDFNRDARADLLVTAHADSEDVMRQLRNPDFRRSGASPRLYRNESGMRFEDVSEKVGLVGIYGTVQAASADLDRDGWLDLIFANGSLDGRRLEASVVLRNDDGKMFRTIASLPAPDGAGNYIGVSMMQLGAGDPPVVYFARNPRFSGEVFLGGAFRLSPIIGKD
jgi:tetratricopeptide (TPR) repeat protein